MSIINNNITATARIEELNATIEMALDKCCDWAGYAVNFKLKFDDGREETSFEYLDKETGYLDMSYDSHLEVSKLETLSYEDEEGDYSEDELYAVISALKDFVDENHEWHWSWEDVVEFTKKVAEYAEDAIEKIVEEYEEYDDEDYDDEEEVTLDDIADYILVDTRDGEISLHKSAHAPSGFDEDRIALKVPEGYSVKDFIKNLRSEKWTAEFMGYLEDDKDGTYYLKNTLFAVRRN